MWVKAECSPPVVQYAEGSQQSVDFVGLASLVSFQEDGVCAGP